jgi:hypothetical protein
MDRQWKAYFLSYDENGIIVSGGKSQGVRVGDVYEVVERGKVVTNPQTGMPLELPGKQVAKVKVSFTGGDLPTNEFSLVAFVEGDIDKNNLSNYYIKEAK